MNVEPQSPETAMLDRLRAAILDEPALAARLAAIVDADGFVTAVQAVAAARAIGLTPPALAAATRPDPLGLARFARPQATQTGWPPADWLPVAVIDGADAPLVEWLHLGGRRLDDPFFEDSVRRARHLPLNRMVPVRTPLATLAEAMPVGAAFTPAGFVFHLSRCGSTLVAQMLAAVPSHVVVSEAAPLDAVLQLADTGALDDPDGAVLRAMVAALLRDRHGDRRAGVVKLDCWHMLAWPRIAAAFPHVPFVFLYRDPVEILVSHARQPGSQTVPGLMPHLAEGPDDAADPPGFAARLLGRIAEAAADAVAAGRATALCYDMLPEAVFTTILLAFGLDPGRTERDAMHAAAARNAKAPRDRFTDDCAAKQAAATPALRDRAAACLAPALARLEGAR